MLGVLVGRDDTLGAADGWLLGWLDGIEVGGADGTAEGVQVGDLIGSAVGVAVGGADMSWVIASKVDVVARFVTLEVTIGNGFTVKAVGTALKMGLVEDFKNPTGSCWKVSSVFAVNTTNLLYSGYCTVQAVAISGGVLTMLPHDRLAPGTDILTCLRI